MLLIEFPLEKTVIKLLARLMAPSAI